MVTPQNPYPEGHEIHKLGRPFLGFHYLILSLSELCMGVEKNIFKRNDAFHYITYMATP